MIGAAGLDDGGAGHGALDVGRPGPWALAEEADLALCTRGLRLDPGAGPCCAGRAVVKPGQAAVFYDGERVLGGGLIQRESDQPTNCT